MPKPSGGSSGSAKLFDTNQTNDGSVATLAWIDLGLIPIGGFIWFGNAQYASPDKTISFELRSNTTGNSSGSDGTTISHIASSVSPRKGTAFIDMYKNGRLNIKTGIGTGSERFWLKLKSKGSVGSYYYSINYTPG